MIPMTSIVAACEADAERRFAASEQAREGATPLRSAHDAIKKGDVMTSRRVKQQSEEQASNAIAPLRDSTFFAAEFKQARGVGG